MGNTYNQKSEESGDDDEEIDNVDINYPFAIDDQCKNGQIPNIENQTRNIQNINSIHKLGTMQNNKILKISAAEQRRRNSQFKDHQTQLVIENLSPFIENAKLQNKFRNEPQSPAPKHGDNFRSFSPYNISEIDGRENTGSRIQQTKLKDTNSRILNQFSDHRKAVSPNLRPSAKEF